MHSNYRVTEIEAKVLAAGFHPLDVLLVGATGVGKSSTLNALFGEQTAKVGTGVDPETQLVESYSLNDVLRFWDSAGLGDGHEADKEHRKKLTDILLRSYTHSDGEWGLIDLVFVVLDGGSRDLGTTYRLLEQVILKMIDTDRIIVAINQADVAMKGRYWNTQNHIPEPELKHFLDEKAHSIQARLLEATGLKINLPVYYSAEENYHINELMDSIIAHIPKKKRSLPKRAA